MIDMFKAFIALSTIVFFLFPGSSLAEEGQLPQPFTESYIGEIETYKSKYEDTLIKIARANNLGFVELRAANPKVDPWLPGDGTTITLPKMHLLPDAEKKGVVVNLPEMRLYIFEEENTKPLSYPIGVGRVGLKTPDGKTKIIDKKTGPTWFPTERMRKEDPSLPISIPAGPSNPLGSHALYLDWPEYAIHGTNRPYGIGRRVSSGCIRLYPEDIVDLYERAEVNTEVVILNQPIKLAWIENKLYLEAHPTLEQSDKVEQNGGPAEYYFSNSEKEQIVKAAGKDFNLLKWDVIRSAIRKRTGVPIVIAERKPSKSLGLKEKGLVLN
jgi:L,D-transpeptidase ErfK/SrfK